MSRRAVVWVALTTIALAGIAVVSTWPVAAHPNTFVVGNPEHPGLQGDLFFQWNLNRQFEEGRIDLRRTTLLRYPEGQHIRPKVMFSLHLWLYLALQRFVGLLAARNLAVLLSTIANGLAMWFLLRERKSNRAYALVAALAFAFSPFVFLKLSQGFLQKTILFHAPLTVLYVLRLLERFRTRDALLCLVVLAVSLAVYPPFCVFNTALAMFLIAGSAWRSWDRRRIALTAGVVVAGAAVAASLVWIIGAEDFVLSHTMPLQLEGYQRNGGYMDPTHPLRWHPYLGTFPGRPFQAFVERLPLGVPLVPLVLALLAAIERRPFARAMLAFAAGVAVTMCGPYLTVGGEPVLIGDSPIPLPMKLLSGLPFGQVLRMPVRLFPWLSLALLVAGSEGLRWIRERINRSERGHSLGRAAVVTVALAVIVEPLLVFPEYRSLEVNRLAPPPYCAEATDGNTAVLHLPYFAPAYHDYELLAVLCDAPVVNPGKYRPSPLPLPSADDSVTDTARTLRVLREQGVGAIVVHPRFYDFFADPRIRKKEPTLGPSAAGHTGADVERTLRRLLGPPAEFPRSDARLYRLKSDLAGGGPEEPHAGQLVAAEQDVPELGERPDRQERP